MDTQKNDLSASGAVVVGVDGSANSVQALEWAATEATARGDALLIMYCLHMPVATAPFANSVAFPQVEELREYADDVLVAVAETARRMAPQVEIRTQLALVPPAVGLLEASDGASLVVVGTRGLSGLGALFLGSVSIRLAARSSCPTVVVPAEGNHDHRGLVVVGVDGSEHSDAALRFALEASHLHDVGLVVIHGRGPVEDLHLPEEAECTEQAQAEDLVASALERVGVDDARRPTVTARVVTAHPADALLEAGKSASLIVLGSHGHGGFRGMLLGSVSQSVLHHADLPVAVVRAGHDAQ